MTKWADKEVTYLRNHWPFKTAKEIAAALNRSILSVTHKANRLGLQKKRNGSLEWTDAEVEYLQKNWPFKTAREIAEVLHRSISAIQHKASRLNLRSDHIGTGQRWNSEEEQFLRDNWENSSLKALSDHLDRSPKTISKKARRLGLRKKRNGNWEWTKEETQYLKDNWLVKDAEKIADHLNRSKQSVQDKAHRLNLTKRWRPWELDILRDFYGWPLMTAKELAETLLDHRSEKAITWKAERLNLRSKAGFVDLTCPVCGESFPIRKSHADTRRCCSDVCNQKWKGRTDIEQLIYDALMETGIQFEEQVPFKPYIVDFHLPEFDLVIECDGKYWHDPETDFERDQYLKSNWNLTTVRFSDTEIKANPLACISEALTMVL